MVPGTAETKRTIADAMMAAGWGGEGMPFEGATPEEVEEIHRAGELTSEYDPNVERWMVEAAQERADIREAQTMALAGLVAGGPKPTAAARIGTEAEEMVAQRLARAKGGPTTLAQQGVAREIVEPPPGAGQQVTRTAEENLMEEIGVMPTKGRQSLFDPRTGRPQHAGLQMEKQQILERMDKIKAGEIPDPTGVRLKVAQRGLENNARDFRRWKMAEKEMNRVVKELAEGKPSSGQSLVRLDKAMAQLPPHLKAQMNEVLVRRTAAQWLNASRGTILNQKHRLGKTLNRIMREEGGEMWIRPETQVTAGRINQQGLLESHAFSPTGQIQLGTKEILNDPLRARQVLGHEIGHVMHYRLHQAAMAGDQEAAEVLDALTRASKTEVFRGPKSEVGRIVRELGGTGAEEGGLPHFPKQLRARAERLQPGQADPQLMAEIRYGQTSEEIGDLLTNLNTAHGQGSLSDEQIEILRPFFDFMF